MTRDRLLRVCRCIALIDDPAANASALHWGSLTAAALLLIAPNPSSLPAQQSKADSAAALASSADFAYQQARPLPWPDTDVDDSPRARGHRAAIELWNRAALLFAELGQPARAGELIFTIATDFHTRGEPDSALAQYHRALAAFRSAAAAQDEAKTLHNIGALRYQMGDCDSGLSYLAQASSAFRRAGKPADGTRRIISELFAQADSARFRRPEGGYDDVKDGGCTESVLSIPSTLIDPVSPRHPDAPRDPDPPVPLQACTPSSRRMLAAQNAPSESVRNSTGTDTLADSPISPEEVESWLYQLEPQVNYPRTLDRQAEDYSNSGIAHLYLGNLYQSLVAFGDALRLSQTLLDCERMISALNSVGRVYHELGFPDMALTYYRRALDTESSAGVTPHSSATLRNLGITHRDLGRADSALSYLRYASITARTRRDHLAEALAMNELGVLNYDLGRPDTALAYFDLASKGRQSRVNQAVWSRAAVNRGVVLQERGGIDSAIVLYQQVLDARRHADDHLGEAMALTGLGRAYRASGSPQEGLREIHAALRILSPPEDAGTSGVPPLERRRVPPWYFRDRLDWLEERLEGITHRAVTSVPRLKLRDLTPAEELALQRRLVFRNEILSFPREIGARLVEATALNEAGAAYFQLGKSDSALAYFHRALPLFRALGHRAGEVRNLYNIAQFHHRSTSPQLPTAIAYYDSASVLVSGITQYAPGDEYKLAFGEKDVALFQNWSLAWLARSAETPSAGSGLASGNDTRLAALGALERGRAQALLDLMRRSAGGSRQTSPAARGVIDEARSLVRTATRGGGAVLSYYLARDTLLLFVADSSGEVRIHRTAISADSLANIVGRFRAALGVDSVAVRSGSLTRAMPSLETPVVVGRGVGVAANGGSWEQAARLLADLLLPSEIFAHLTPGTELVLLTHVSLNLVPFAALPLPSGEPLSHRFSLRYVPSLAALRDAEARPVKEPIGATALVVGNPVMPSVLTDSGGAKQLAPLPGAETEGEWVAQRVGSRVLRQDEATEAVVRERLPSATLVHLATHGFSYSSEARARDSFIALAPTRRYDGLLTVGEILDDIPVLVADLVVLSACQTGLGNLREAEGTVGLQRAFLAKGARSVLVTLWSVDDEATRLLMERFYTHWLDPRGLPALSKAEALRLAQRDVRSEARFSNPRYWAAFQLVGAR